MTYPKQPGQDADAHRRLAQAFHEHYERLAPSHGYATQESSRVPWDKLPAPLANLMIATVEAVCADKGVVDPEAHRQLQEGWAAMAAIKDAAVQQLAALREKLERRERQMGLAAKYIDEYYELARDMHDPTALMDVGKIDAARRMVFAIGADLTRILAEDG